VLFRYERALEPPDAAEGFSAIEEVPFRRKPTDLSESALVVWLDGVCGGAARRRACQPRRRTSSSCRDSSGCGARGRGFLLFGLTWRPDLGEADGISKESLEECFARLRESSGCRCRSRTAATPPGRPCAGAASRCPGSASSSSSNHRLDAARSLFVGRSRLDRTFAERVGFAYRDAARPPG
jgi:hypothetical protein